LPGENVLLDNGYLCRPTNARDGVQLYVNSFIYVSHDRAPFGPDTNVKDIALDFGYK
jgi:hypothetical protein